MQPTLRGTDYAALCEGFAWRFPDRLNLAAQVCDDWAARVLGVHGPFWTRRLAAAAVARIPQLQRRNRNPRSAAAAAGHQLRGGVGVGVGF